MITVHITTYHVHESKSFSFSNEFEWPHPPVPGMTIRLLPGFPTIAVALVEANVTGTHYVVDLHEVKVPDINLYNALRHALQEAGWVDAEKEAPVPA